MNSKLKMVFMLVALAGLVLAAGLAFGGCATASQVHSTVVVGAPTALITGPARGHWAEQDDNAVIVWTVFGGDCTNGEGPGQAPKIAVHDTFTLLAGETLCAGRMLGNKQIVLLHAERPESLGRGPFGGPQ